MFVLTLMMLSACSEFWLDPVESEPVATRVLVRETFVQEGLPAVDLLFVIDNSASMAGEQAALAQQFSGFANTLDQQHVRWQVGITSSDVSGAEAGWLVGFPWILASSTSDVAEHFAQSVQMDAAQLGPETGVLAALAALDLSQVGEVNAGFRRDDAALQVIFVSDSDDQSGDDAVHRFLNYLSDESEQSDLPARASAIVGDLPSGCVSVTGDARSAPVYTALSVSSGGQAASICAGDVGDVLSDIAASLSSGEGTFFLQSAPVVSSLRVSLDGQRVESGWRYYPAGPSVVFDPAALPRAGTEVLIQYVVEER